ncbi:nucleotidyltransferase domain-containing protein [Candidatus Woesearchaeota archaeon]|nr:MAG: hypothetical protein QS99_C0003G0012 [archaeon GW2011_AR4]MBS3129358.1 nucleotidyltransferase domain-containing protein [Candidatus Woesearchaeota archaeon]HIH37611.1 nucleotidyltransferase domain-containing protein [Candidatus Woesearchaeota archaeon]HIH48772.1 nucleotidyltransferase domain-containing protein [Candidatus Woesearchaeota archaeon]HIJ03582.1 nucleotidyltransferase domain-containing protein [Candidatus Woesearchaeota archaeon]
MSKLIAFAMDFASYLMQHVEIGKVDEILLFGSVARGDAGKKSDVDIFLATNDPAIEKKILALVDSFYTSKRFTGHWKLLGIENMISVKVGKLDEWAIKEGVVSDGIVLYGKYQGKMDGALYGLYTLHSKKNRAENVRIWRKLYGYSQKVGKKTYVSEGFIDRYGGKKLSNGVFIIPIKHLHEMIAFLQKQKVPYTVMEVSSAQF